MAILGDAGFTISNNSGAAYQAALKSARAYAAKVHRSGVPWDFIQVMEPSGYEHAGKQIIVKVNRAMMDAQSNPSKRATRKRVSRSLTKYVKGFTGSITRNPDGTVVIVGTGPKPKGARAVGKNPMDVAHMSEAEYRAAFAADVKRRAAKRRGKDPDRPLRYGERGFYEQLHAESMRRTPRNK